MSFRPRVVRTEPHPSRIGVLVVSAVPLLREGISRIVERMSDAGVTGAVSTLGAAEDRLRTRGVDVVVVDEHLDPSFHGVRRLARAAAVTSLLAHRTPAMARAPEAVRAGAKGVIPGAAPAALVIDVVRTAAHRKPVVSSTVDGRGMRTVLEFGGPGGVLSPREIEVLQLIAHGLDNRAIADHLVLSVETVRTHAKNLARKLGASHRSQVTAIAYQSGFVATVGGGERLRRRAE